MAKVLELINSGATDLPSDDVELGRGMISIIQSLQINIDLEPATIDNIHMTSQSMTDVSDQLLMMSQKMTDVSDQLEMMSQKMPEKHENNQMMSLKMPKKQETNQMVSQKMRETCYEIGIAESCDAIKMTAQEISGKQDKMQIKSQKYNKTQKTSQKIAETCNEIRIPESFKVTEKTSQEMFEIAEKHKKMPNNSNDHEMNENLAKLPMPYR